MTTAEGQPSPPEQFRLVGSAFATAFQVTWSPPTHLRGILQDYLLTIIPECKTRAAECSNGSNTVQESTVAPLDCDPRNVTKMVLAANVTEYLFVDGMAATAYIGTKRLNIRQLGPAQPFFLAHRDGGHCLYRDHKTKHSPTGMGQAQSFLLAHRAGSHCLYGDNKTKKGFNYDQRKQSFCFNKLLHVIYKRSSGRFCLV